MTLMQWEEPPIFQGYFRQGQDLANQLSEQAQGRGPNPALAQLQQTTGQNVANQAALMASRDIVTGKQIGRAHV